MTDKDMVKLAAKAAKIELASWDEESQKWYRVTDDPGKFRQTGNGYASAVFDPLTDDGDALRLAVKLNFCITQWRDHSQYKPHVMVGYKTSPKEGSNWIEEYGQDDMAANRRAIVCASAEVAKAMP